MSEFLSFAERLKDLGATVLIVGASIFFLFRYMPVLARRQGELNEIIKNNSAVIEACSTVLKMVAVKDKAIEESLERIEKHVNEIGRDVCDLKHIHRRD